LFLSLTVSTGDKFESFRLKRHITTTTTKPFVQKKIPQLLLVFNLL